jgi:hypothetical protein
LRKWTSPVPASAKAERKRGRRARRLRQRGDAPQSEIAAVRAGYADGEASCVINLLGIGEAGDKFSKEQRDTLDL